MLSLRMPATPSRPPSPPLLPCIPASAAVAAAHALHLLGQAQLWLAHAAYLAVSAPCAAQITAWLQWVEFVLAPKAASLSWDFARLGGQLCCISGREACAHSLRAAHEMINSLQCVLRRQLRTGQVWGQHGRRHCDDVCWGDHLHGETAGRWAGELGGDAARFPRREVVPSF